MTIDQAEGAKPMSEQDNVVLTDHHFRTSERLEALQSDLEATEMRLASVAHHRGEAATQRAEGVEGAEERLQELHAETERLERHRDDTEAAISQEQARLKNEHQKAVQAAQADRAERLDSARQDLEAKAKTVEKRLRSLKDALDAMSQASAYLDRLAKVETYTGAGAERPLTEADKRIRGFITSRAPQPETAKLEDSVPSLERILRDARMPDRLDHFEEVNTP